MNRAVALVVLIGMQLLVALPASAQTPREKNFPKGEFFHFDGRAAFILRPEKASIEKNGEQKALPWIFYAPTLSAYPDTHEQWMHQKILDADISIAGIDVGEAYGSPEARKVFDRFYDELTERRQMSKRPCLLGRSRGGLWVTSWACDHPDRFAALAGIYPVFDFRTYPGIEKAAPAYGLTPAELTAQIATHNPILRAEAIAKAKLPVFIIHGDEDTVVPLKENSAALAELYRTHNSSALELKIVKGQGHNFWPGFFQCQELVDFLIKHAKQ